MPPPVIPERFETLSIAKRLNTFIPLPNLINWKVHESDVLHRGRVLSMLRTKRFFLPDGLSSLKMRMATVTRHGYLLIYETKDEGLIVDLRSASHIFTECDKYKSKKVKYSRSHIKIRLPHGNIHFFVRDDDIFKWTSSLLEAHVSCRPKVLAMVKNGPKKEDVNLPTRPPRIADTAVTAIEPIDSYESPTSPMTSSNSGLITVIEKVTISEDSMNPSVRRGVVPVGTLRCKIEKDLDISPKVETLQKSSPPEPKSFMSLLVFHDGKPTQKAPMKKEEDVEGMEEDSDDNKEKKEWWMRSLRC